MKRSEMTCRTCIKFDGAECRLFPQPVPVAEPDTHWCAKGQWQRWSDRYNEMEPYYWGEWDPDSRG